MDSVSLVRLAERAARRQRGASQRNVGDNALDVCSERAVDPTHAPAWGGVAARFCELAPRMDFDLVARLLDCFVRVRFSDSAALSAVVQALDFEAQTPKALARWATPLASLREELGAEATAAAFARAAVRAGQFDEVCWGLSAPLMLVAFVKCGDVVWSPAHRVLIRSIAASSSRMGPMQLEVSAYACARVARALANDSSTFRERGETSSEGDLASAAEALLRNGMARADRLLLRGLLNFFVAMERLAGAVAVRDIAAVVARRIEASCTADRGRAMSGCTAGDRYRAALCLLRSGAATPAVLSPLVLSDGISVRARITLARHLRRGFQESLGISTSVPPDAWGELIETLEAESELQAESTKTTVSKIKQSRGNRFVAVLGGLWEKFWCKLYCKPDYLLKYH